MDYVQDIVNRVNIDFFVLIVFTPAGVNVKYPQNPLQVEKF